MLASLDTNVIDALARSRIDTDALKRGFKGRLLHEPEFYITATTAFEILEGDDLERRVNALDRLGTRFMWHTIRQFMEWEKSCGNAYEQLKRDPWLPIRTLLETRQAESWPEMHQKYRASKKVMEESIAGIESNMAKREKRLEELGPATDYETYVEMRRHQLMEALVSHKAGRPDVDKLWTQGKAVRAMNCLMLATIYRRLTNAPGAKAHGAYSDDALVAESAYGDVILTKDVQLAKCGELMNRSLVPAPRIFLVKDVIE